MQKEKPVIENSMLCAKWCSTFDTSHKPSLCRLPSRNCSTLRRAVASESKGARAMAGDVSTLPA